jgi:hypothetical protein
MQTGHRCCPCVCHSYHTLALQHAYACSPAQALYLFYYSSTVSFQAGLGYSTACTTGDVAGKHVQSTPHLAMNCTLESYETSPGAAGSQAYALLLRERQL